MLEKRFTRLLVKEQLHSTKQGKKRWLCLCDCGQLTIVTTGDLNSQHTQSCGCLNKNTTKRKPRITHGHACNGNTTPTYQSWRAMHQRCNCPKNKDYHSYGGRGISICARWDSFELFLTDMGERPSKNYSLDRLNPDNHYDPSNCAWVTKSENSKKGNAQRQRV